MEPSPLVQQGIAAYKAGNKEEAVRLLSEALRENRQDENAWLYLGAAIDDPGRKRQAFEQVLAINPDNEKAKNALARLDAGVSGTARPAARSGGATVTEKPKSDKPRIDWSQEKFALPFHVEGAPESVTIPYLIENARTRIQEAVNIYLNRDYDTYMRSAQGATMWDSVFVAGIGVVAMGAAELVGRIIGWPLSGFHGGILGLLLVPIFSAIVSMAGTAAGFAGGVFASKWYLDNQGIKISLPQHSMYFAMIFLPLVLVSAATTLLTHAIGFLVLCLAPIFLLVGIAMLLYGWFLLKGAFDRVYGTDQNRGLITAAISVGGWVVASVVVSILFSILRFG